MLLSFVFMKLLLFSSFVIVFVYTFGIAFFINFNILLFWCMHTVNLGCSGKGTSFEKTPSVINLVQFGSINKDFIAYLNRLKTCIGYISKKITEFMGKCRRNMFFFYKISIELAEDQRNYHCKTSLFSSRNGYEFWSWATENWYSKSWKLDATAVSVLRSSNHNPQIVHSMPNVEEVLSLFVYCWNILVWLLKIFWGAALI